MAQTLADLKRQYAMKMKEVREFYKVPMWITYFKKCMSSNIVLD